MLDGSFVGVGKSTLVRPLNRFYDPDHGSILINGINIASVQQDSLRKHIGIVPQDVSVSILIILKC